jgi:hypothetical protein
MDTKEILRKAALLKRNPQLANVIPNSEIIALVTDVLGAFTTLQKAIETNKLKGDKGDDGATPVSGKDYPSFEQIDGVLSDALADYGTKYQNLQNELQKAILRASELTNGKDAEITDELIEEVAQMAYSLIELPDFDTLVSTEITRNSEAIRDALELLQGKDRYQVEIADVQGLAKALNELRDIIYRSTRSGGVGKSQVYGWIAQAVVDGTIPNNGGGSINVIIPTGTVDSSNVTFTSPTLAKWIDTDTGRYFPSRGYTASGSGPYTYTLDLAPNTYIYLVS